MESQQELVEQSLNLQEKKSLKLKKKSNWIKLYGKKDSSSDNYVQAIST